MFKLLVDYGSDLVMKSVVHANGDLYIVGEDQKGKSKFMMVIKASDRQRPTFTSVSGGGDTRQSMVDRNNVSMAEEDYEELMNQAMNQNLEWRTMDEVLGEDLAIASQLMNFADDRAAASPGSGFKQSF